MLLKYIFRADGLALSIFARLDTLQMLTHAWHGESSRIVAMHDEGAAISASGAAFFAHEDNAIRCAR